MFTNFINRFIIPYLQTKLTPVLDDLLEKAQPVIARSVTEMIDEVISGKDIESEVEQAIDDAHIDREVERAIEESHIERAIEEAIDEYDIDTAMESRIEDYEFDEAFEEKVKAMIRKQIKAVLIEMAEEVNT